MIIYPLKTCVPSCVSTSSLSFIQTHNTICFFVFGSLLARFTEHVYEEQKEERGRFIVNMYQSYDP